MADVWQNDFVDASNYIHWKIVVNVLMENKKNENGMIEEQHEWPCYTKNAVQWIPFECASANYHVTYRPPNHPHQRWDDHF